MIRADFDGSIVMGSVDVCMICVGPVTGDECTDGWVRLNPFLEECNQKFEGEPIKALRCGSVGIVEDMVAAIADVIGLGDRC